MSTIDFERDQSASMRVAPESHVLLRPATWTLHSVSTTAAHHLHGKEPKLLTVKDDCIKIMETMMKIIIAS